MGDITQEREKGRSASAQDGTSLCTTPMPQLSRNPRMHCRKTPFAQPYSRAATKEACHGREACCGRHNPRERERKVSKCIRWDRSVHHTHATAPHATLACIAEKRLLHSTHSLRRRKHATGGKRVVGDITQEREKGRSASAQDGAGLCTTPMPQLLTQPPHALPTKPIAQPYSRAATKEACHGREACCGRHNPRERERKVSKCTRWDKPVHHTHATALTQPSHALPENALCTTVLTPCDEGRMTQEGSVLWET